MEFRENRKVNLILSLRRGEHCRHMPQELCPAPFHGIFQARVLEWVAMSFSRGSSQPRDGTCISWVSCIGRQIICLPIFLSVPGGSAGKESTAMRETWVRSLGWEDPLEEDMATHSSTLAWGSPVDRGTWRAAVHRVAKSQT